MPPTWLSARVDRIEISVKMASQLLLKLRQIYTVELIREFLAIIDASLPTNRYPNLCQIELCLVHGVQRELTALKYLSKWRHNCSSNYGNVPTQRNGLILRISREYRVITK